MKLYGLLVVTALSVTGCAGLGVASILSALSSGASTPGVSQTVLVQGVVRIGNGSGVSGLLSSSQLVTNVSPLTNGAALSSAGPLTPVNLTSATPLTIASPLVSNNAGGLVSNNAGGLVSNNAGGLVGQNVGGLFGAASYRTDTRHLLSAGGGLIFIEAVDPTTGAVVLRTVADTYGQYRFVLPKPLGSLNWILQATIVNDAGTTGFLATPLRINAGTIGVMRSDLSPGSTAATFALAQLAGVRSEFKVNPGFRGFSTQELAELVAVSDPQAEQSAVRVIDSGTDIVSAPAFDQLLTSVASVSSQVAVSADSKLAQVSTGKTLSTLAAAENRIMAAVGSQTPSASQSTAQMVAFAAAAVSPDAIAADATRITAAYAAFKNSLLAVLPSPAPSATPTPAPAATPTAATNPTPAAAASATPMAATSATPTPASGGSLVSAAGVTVSTLANSAMSSPMGLAYSAGKLYVSDDLNNVVGGYTLPSGTGPLLSSFVVGKSSVGGYKDDVYAQTQFHSPRGLAVDSSGALLVADSGNNVIRKVSNGSTATLALTPSTFSNPYGASMSRYADQAFNGPVALAVALDGSLYVADQWNGAIRKVDTQMNVTSVICHGGCQQVIGSGDIGSFDRPSGLALAPDGSIVVAEGPNNCIQQVTAAGAVSTLAGSCGNTSASFGFKDGKGPGARFSDPQDITTDGRGVFFILDIGNYAIRRLTLDGNVTTLAGGTNTSLDKDGKGTDATFKSPLGIVFGGNSLYVSEADGIRVIH